jgi:hypothetical protein
MKRKFTITTRVANEEEDLRRAIKESLYTTQLDLVIQESLEGAPLEVKRKIELERYQENNEMELALTRSVELQNIDDYRNMSKLYKCPELFVTIMSISDVVAKIFYYLPQIKDMIEIWRVFGNKPRINNYSFLIEIARKMACERYGWYPSPSKPIEDKKEVRMIINHIPYTPKSAPWRFYNTSKEQIFKEFVPNNDKLLVSLYTSQFWNVHCRLCFDMSLPDLEFKDAYEKKFLKVFSGIIYYKIKNFTVAKLSILKLRTILGIDDLDVTSYHKKIERCRILITLEHFSNHQAVSDCFDEICELVGPEHNVTLWHIHTCGKSKGHLHVIEPNCFPGCALAGILIFGKNELDVIKRVNDTDAFDFK